MRRTTIRAGAGLLAAVLVLSGCGRNDDPAETTTEGTDADRVAALEEALEELRDEPADGGDDEGAAADEGDARTVSEDGEVVEPRVFDVNETQTSPGGDVEVTVERLIVQDYHVEVELSATNSHPEGDAKLWRGGISERAPMLFDEQDRRFEYQHAAGYDGSDYVTLAPGERLEAVMMFGRRLHPDARQLTLRFQDGILEDLEWAIALPEDDR